MICYSSSSSSSPLFCFCVITTLLCFVSSVISQPDFTYKFCIDNGNYTKNSTYQTNLNTLFSTINSNTQIDYGFYNFSSGTGPDKVNAIALCRADVTQPQCRRCLKDSTIKLAKLCPYNKEAIGWYDFCMLRYSNNATFFNTHTSAPRVTMWNVQNVTSNVTRYVAAVRNLMGNLSSNASSGDSRRKFSTGEVSLTRLEQIYGLVQCTPDLSKSQCSTCFDEALTRLRNCCSTYVGARVLRPSCNVRWEMYNFYESAVPLPPSTSPPPPMVQTNTTTSLSGNEGSDTSRTIIISTSNVSIAMFILFIVFL